MRRYCHGIGRESSQPDLRHLTLHGHRVAYRHAGDGPTVVLIHGITADSRTWSRVMPSLARRFTVIAPDLAGHGGSDKPKGDYSLGAHASAIRDLMVTLGHDRASSWGTRSVGASRCSSPTSFRSAASGSYWSTAAASGAR